MTFYLFSKNISLFDSSAVFTIGILSPVSIDSLTITLPWVMMRSHEAISPSLIIRFSPNPISFD